MKVVVLGDFSNDGHFGCKLVSKAILENLEKRGCEIIRVVPCSRHWRYYEDDLKKCDLVVVNGEGSIHHGRGMQFLEVASEYPSVLINAVYQDVPENDHLKRFLYVSVRESRSAEEMKKHGVTPEIIPDVIFYHDIPKPKATKDLCIVGSVTNQREKPKEVDLDAYDPDFIEKFGQYKRTVTGRFHALCLAMMWNMPFMAYPSNTHKVLGMLEDFGYSEAYLSCFHEAIVKANFGSALVPQHQIESARQKIKHMFDSICDINPLKTHITVNTPNKKLLNNIRLSKLRNLPEVERLPPRNDRVAIVGGGPSLKETWLKLKTFEGLIVATNNSHDFLIGKGIKPDFYVMCDAKSNNVEYLRNPDKKITYLISSKCHPSVFKALKKQHVYLWHEWLNIGEPEDVLRICGGSTVGLKSINLMYMLGFHNFHLFGMDSCITDDHHAYKQKVNDSDMDKTVTIICGEKKFKCANWMALQADDFRQILASLGHLFNITIHGGGLLSKIIDEGNRLNRKHIGGNNASAS